MTKSSSTQAPQAQQDSTTALESATEAPEAQEQATETVESIASAVGATPKDVRRWLRAQTRATLGKAGAADVLPGKGGRYAFTPTQAQQIGALYGTRKAQAGTQAPALAILSALAPQALVADDMTPRPGQAPAL